MNASRPLQHAAPAPALGSVAEGYEPVAATFARQLERGEHVGAGFVVYRGGTRVIDLWGGHADRRAARPWARDSRIVVFSVTKGFVAMALHLLADRNQLEWDRRVADYWPAFGRHGKQGITVRDLVNHRAGLAAIDPPFTLADCLDETRRPHLLQLLEEQSPQWPPGLDQGYHAITFGLYVSELFSRVAGEPLGGFLRRELFEPLGSDVHLGTPASEDDKQATLYAPSVPARLTRLVGKSLFQRDTPEALITRSLIDRDSASRRAFANPRVNARGVLVYNDVEVRRAALAWASATASADGIARAYLPFAQGGEHDGQRYFSAGSLEPLFRRQSWAAEDRVLHKPLGWSQGFLKEERHVFCPHPESFGHAGMGGSLGWCDPISQVSLGYVTNKMDWRVRSKRALQLCRSLYECEPMFD